MILQKREILVSVIHLGEINFAINFNYYIK